MPLTSELALTPLNKLVGTWSTEATHPALPGVTVHGTASVEWLEGERFLIVRARTDHPEFPDSISILGFMERDRAGASAAAPTDPQLSMHYYDSRGVFRECEASIDDEAWRIVRMAAGFSQRFKGSFADGGATIVGVWQLCQDGVNWTDDLKITYRRRP